VVVERVQSDNRSATGLTPGSRPLTGLASLPTVQFPDLDVGEPPRREHRTLADHVLVGARLAAGAPLSVEVAGGRPPKDTPFRLEVVGEPATLALVEGHRAGYRLLTALLDREPQPVDDLALAGLSPSATNVASLHAELRDDIVHGTRVAPDFEHARRLSHLIDDIRAADRRG